MIARSSSTDHLFLFTSGVRWLYQRSRHCLPVRPDIAAPTTDQRTLAPHAAISSRSFWSSSADQTCFFQHAAAPLSGSLLSGASSDRESSPAEWLTGMARVGATV